MEQIIRFPGGSLASRHSAIPFRDQIIRLFEDNNYSRIIIDLSDTEIISGSFADECIGILVRIYGWDAVKSKIRLSDTSPTKPNMVGFSTISFKLFGLLRSFWYRSKKPSLSYTLCLSCILSFEVGNPTELQCHLCEDIQ